ncbi:MAG: ATP synthase F1 subunit epsilon [Solirubrobacterales bacterium]
MAEQSHKLEAEVLTPDGAIYEGELYQVSVRTVAGEIGIRARHVPMLARIVPHELRLFESESDFSNGKPKSFAAAEGWLEVFANRVVVLVGEAHEAGEIDASAQKEKVSEAEQALEEAEEDSAAEETAQRDLDRAKAFLEMAE